MKITRRQFLKYLGMGACSALGGSFGPVMGCKSVSRSRRSWQNARFDPIQPSYDDRLVLPTGFRHDIVCSWGDLLGSRAPMYLDAEPDGMERFGFNNDFTAFFPIDGLSGGSNCDEGLLWVNHEFPDPLFVSGFSAMDYQAAVVDPARRKTRAMIQLEKLSVGGTVLYVKRDETGHWRASHHPVYTRRLTALYPAMRLTGPAAELISLRVENRQVPLISRGTLGNCSGGRTPWLTVLSCEEGFTDFNEGGPTKEGFRWCDQPGEAIDEEQFGWVVEVDPYFPERPPIKHTALGHFRHENAAMRWDGPDSRFVVYMGDDEADQFLYKYVSRESYRDSSDRASITFREASSRLLADGTLYAANFSTGCWLPLDLKNERSSSILRRTAVLHRNQTVMLDSMALVLLHARAAAYALGATPLDRPEDCEIHPLDGSLYVALTNNAARGNFHGTIVRLLEAYNNPESESFNYEVCLAGGEESGLSCPNNLTFDRKGNLWVACDISNKKLGRDPYTSFGNNGVFVVPTSGPNAGEAFQFASGPIGSELTGPWFTEDGKTLFLSVQHPGDGSLLRDQPISHWPNGGGEIPKPSVVAISGFLDAV